jgi:Holliday junction DNA helicase RuvA
MICRLRGVVAGGPEASGGVVEVLVGGVGYAVRVTAGTIKQSPDLIELLIHVAAGDAGWTLYGFLREEERAAFRRLLKVGRLGPALAMKILDGIGVAELDTAIRCGDAARLEQINGVGEKMARMICVTLGEKPPAQGKSAGLLQRTR